MSACLAALHVCAQAWDNFKQEWMQLRRSFRFNEYGKISAVNPAQGPIGKVTTGQRWWTVHTHTGIQQPQQRTVCQRGGSISAGQLRSRHRRFATMRLLF